YQTDDEGASVARVGVDASVVGSQPGRHAAHINLGRQGVFQVSYSDLMEDEDGQIIPSHSISAGLDYPGVGPEHSALHAEGRAEYFAITDAEAMEAFRLLTRLEGILPAIESAHGVAAAIKYAEREDNPLIIVNVSGRGDKDVATAAKWFAKEGN